MDPSTTPGASLWATQGTGSEAASATTLPRLEPATAARILTMAFGIGVLTQLLLVGQGIGINIVLLVGALLAGATAVRHPMARLDRLDRWLPPAALVFAALTALRASPSLLAFDLSAALALAGAAVAALMGVTVTRRAASVVVLLGLVFSVGSVAGALGLGPGVGHFRRRLATTRASAAGPFVRGVLIAAPIVAVFAILFGAADAVFARVLGDAFALHLDVEGIVIRLIVVGLVTWAVGGLFATGVEPSSVERQVTFELGVPAPEAVTRSRIGAVESSIVILAVDLVFALFVALQVPYLFGGQDTLALTGVTYSDYARRGFFELMAAAFLAGILVTGFDALLGRRVRVFAAGAIGLALLAGMVLVSAVIRLGLYQQAYGWTELRFLVLAGIVWVGACLVAASVLIASGRTRWLPHAGAVLGLFVALAVNLADPQAFVTAQNVDRALHPEQIAPGGSSGLDGDYLATLSDDAVPTLVAALSTLPRDETQQLQRALRRRYQELEQAARTEGWPSANLARSRALEALRGLSASGGRRP